MSVWDLGLVVVGLAVLTGGAELLVKGAAGGARRLGASALVVGLTVVAYGTSTPELAVSAEAAWSGSADIAIGNVVGSNIFNVLVVLGLSALIAPLPVARALLRIDVPIMIAASLMTVVAASDGRIGRLEGGLLAASCVAYTLFLVAQLRRSRDAEAVCDAAVPVTEGTTPSWRALLGYTLGGLLGLVLGADLFVQGATGVARALGISELVIGLTLVAAGTSLPELATSIVAAVRGERDIAVGSNIFNCFAVLGTAGLVSSAGIPVESEVLRFDLPFMCAITVACLPIFLTGARIDRWEGGLLLAYYAAYATYLYLSETRVDAAAIVRDAMLYVALPATALLLGVAVVRGQRPRDHVSSPH